MLERNGALAMLRDPAIRTATREIRDDKSKTRAEIQVPTMNYYVLVTVLLTVAADITAKTALEPRSRLKLAAL
jgi:hypothetical protein